MLEQDFKAREIASMWNEFSEQRDSWLARTADVRRYLTAPDTKYTDVGQLPWKNKTTIPKITQIYDNLLAQYISALMPNQDWFVFESEANQDEEISERDNNIEKYLRVKLQQANYRQFLREVLSDWLIYGVTCGGASFMHKRGNKPDGSGYTTYFGAVPFRVSPYDYVVDPKAPSFESSPFIRRRVIKIGDLIKENSQNNLIRYDDDAIEKAKSIRGYVREDEDAYKDEELRIDGFSSLRDYFLSNYVEILEFWGDIYVPETGEFLENRCISVLDRMFTILDIENPMYDKQKPFSFVGWRERPDNLYAQSPLEQLAGMQYRIDHLENVKADVFDLTAHPVVEVRGDPTEDFKWEPGFIYYSGTEGQVVIHKPDAQALQADTEIMWYTQMMEEMAGAPKQTAGFRTPGEKTAFEVNVLQEGAMKMFIEKTEHFDNTFNRRMLEIIFQLTVMNYNPKDVVKTIGEDGMPETVYLTEEDIVTTGRFKPIGSSHYKKRNKTIQELAQFAQYISSIPSVSQHLDGYKLGQIFEQTLGYDDYNFIKEFKAITDQIEAQMVAQQAQQEYQQMMGQPPQGQPPQGQSQQPQQMPKQEGEGNANRQA